MCEETKGTLAFSLEDLPHIVYDDVTNSKMTFRQPLTSKELLKRFQKAEKVKANKGHKIKRMNLSFRTIRVEYLQRRKIITMRQDKMKERKNKLIEET